jgi:hypothetical protein
MTRRLRRTGSCLAAMLLVPGCAGGEGGNEADANLQAAGEPRTVDIPQTVTAVAPGTTPMAERVAVLGLLNKRNGIARDVTLKPGQAVRLGDVVVRLRACETSAPWEVQSLTGAFVQLDVRNPQDHWQRVFSGWLYKETPSLNVVEHPVYDVWPKSCTMTHPDSAGSAAPPAAEARSRSSAPKSGTGGRTAVPPASPRPAPAAEAPSQPPVASADSNSAR